MPQLYRPSCFFNLASRLRFSRPFKPLNMNILYLEEHLACKNYMFKTHSQFKHFLLNKEDEFEFNSKSENIFLFMLKGRIELENFNGQVILLEESQMISLGYAFEYIGKTLENSEFLLLVFNQPQILCDTFSFLEMRKYLPKKSQIPNILPILPAITSFLQSMIFYLENQMYCAHLQDIKQSEWLFLMRAFYTKEENAAFFSPFLEEKNGFLLILKAKANGATSVKELAESCNMTTKTLTRNFKKYLNTTPKKWLNQKKQPFVQMRKAQPNIIQQNLVTSKLPLES